MQPQEPSKTGEVTRELYQQQMLAIRTAFDGGAAGLRILGMRSDAVDQMLRSVWERVAVPGIAVLAIGGYGRRQLFPYSDVDLLFIHEAGELRPTSREAIRLATEALWDAGLRMAPVTRSRTECTRMDANNAEFALALLDARFVTGHAELARRLIEETVPAMIDRDRRALTASVTEMTLARHARYGGTLFHLEPNVKDCPGGLRDTHVCDWMQRLHPHPPAEASQDEESAESLEFLSRVRCFLHYRHRRDNNVLDWQMQDAAAEAGIGLTGKGRPDPAYWMRIYFRHARGIYRRVTAALEEGAAVPARPAAREASAPAGAMRGFTVEGGRIQLAPAPPGGFLDPASNPDVVLPLFAEMARSGCVLDRPGEDRLSHALPRLAGNLEEGTALSMKLQEILLGPMAGDALRAMHALGLLELLVPEFHGIDALVIRDAYHRYTVDEHTFVVIDTLHSLASPVPGALEQWAAKLGALLAELPRPGLLYLAALLHDTGKGRATEVFTGVPAAHTRESARMAEGVLARLELDAYETALVVDLILNHVEMSAALRRDIFDEETVRGFAGKVKTPEMLRMLTLFTYADIQAVHPDAVTPWKAENLWRLYMATSNLLDRSVDEERVRPRSEDDLVQQIATRIPQQQARVAAFLEGFPERYTKTRKADQIREHFQLTEKLHEEPVQFAFRYTPEVSEITLITPDRVALFAQMTGVLAAWGMNIVSGDAFSNREGVAVDSFRFTDAFRTLEMNPEERVRLLDDARSVMNGTLQLDKLLAGRRRGAKRPARIEVETRIDFDDDASSQSTLLQVVTHDSPGLLRALSLTLAEHQCNIGVALIDTEGERAIDVFYLTIEGRKLQPEEQVQLGAALREAIEENARAA